MKLATGGCLAVLSTALVFGPMGFGRRYVDNLRQRVRADLDARQLGDVDVAVQDAPTLQRAVILSGKVSASDRLAAMRVSRNVSGVADVRWSTDVTGPSSYTSGIEGGIGAAQSVTYGRSLTTPSVGKR